MNRSRLGILARLELDQLEVTHWILIHLELDLVSRAHLLAGVRMSILWYLFLHFW
jgi:hypothetical protein